MGGWDVRSGEWKVGGGYVGCGMWDAGVWKAVWDVVGGGIVVGWDVK